MKSATSQESSVIGSAFTPEVLLSMFEVPELREGAIAVAAKLHDSELGKLGKFLAGSQNPDIMKCLNKVIAKLPLSHRASLLCILATGCELFKQVAVSCLVEEMTRKDLPHNPLSLARELLKNAESECREVVITACCVVPIQILKSTTRRQFIPDYVLREVALQATDPEKKVALMVLLKYSFKINPDFFFHVVHSISDIAAKRVVIRDLVKNDSHDILSFIVAKEKDECIRRSLLDEMTQSFHKLAENKADKQSQALRQQMRSVCEELRRATVQLQKYQNIIVEEKSSHVSSTEDGSDVSRCRETFIVSLNNTEI